MATKQFYATGDFKYGTRMLRAGDGPISMDGPTARLYTALKKISPTKPKNAQPYADPAQFVAAEGTSAPSAAQLAEGEKVAVAPKARKHTAKKRTRKAK